MAFDKEFLLKTLEGVEGAENIAGVILKEYEVDTIGLKKNKDDALSESKKHKASLETISKEKETIEAELQKRIETLETQLKATGNDELKAIHEAELKKLQEIHGNAVNKAKEKETELSEKLTSLQSEHLSLLKNSEFDRALDKIQNLDRSKVGILRDAFWARNTFTPSNVADDNGALRNQESRRIEDVLSTFINSDEGKFFVLSNNTGGGATGSNSAKPPIGNPFIKGKENLTEQGRLLKENPAKYNELKAQAETLAKGG